MKGFIEVTPKGCGKSLIAVSTIKRVNELCGGKCANIVTVEGKRFGYGFTTKESYAEIVKKIKEAVE